MISFDTFTPAIFHACHLVQPADRGEYGLPDAIDPLTQSGRTIDAIRLNGWRSREHREGDRFETDCREVPKNERRSHRQGALDSERRSRGQRAGFRVMVSPDASKWLPRGPRPRRRAA